MILKNLIFPQSNSEGGRKKKKVAKISDFEHLEKLLVYKQSETTTGFPYPILKLSKSSQARFTPNRVSLLLLERWELCLHTHFYGWALSLPTAVPANQ